MVAWHQEGWFLGGISADHILLTLTDWEYSINFLDWSTSYIKVGNAFKRQMLYSYF